MKRTLLLLLILLLSAFSLFADDKTDTLIVKAYKKKVGTEASFDARVIDALTGSLDVITKNAEIDMSNYVNKFLGTFITSVSDAKAIRNRAIFSFHCGGNYTGTFTVTIKFESLAYCGEDGTAERDTSKYIATQYWFLKDDFKAYFGANRTNTAKDSNNKDETITIIDEHSDEKNLSATVYGGESETTGTIEFKWKVTGYSESTDTPKQTITQNTWDVEAMVAMILLENDSGDYKGYNSADNGYYRAPVTITMNIT